MTNQELRERVASALAELGTTSDTVASSLEALGVTGTPQVADNCPLYNYLHDLKGLPVCGVDQGVVRLRTKEGAFLEFPQPVPCSEFVEEFDVGKYPSLLTEYDEEGENDDF